MALASNTNATQLTAEQVAHVLVEPLAQKSVFLSACPNIIDTAGPLRLPLGAAPTNPAWYGQNEQIVEVDPEFGELSLLPSTMKSVKVLTRFSNELARQSVVALDAALRTRLVTDVAGAIDAQLLSAGGDGITKPKGLFAYAGTQKLPVNGVLSLDPLLFAEGMALEAGADPDGLAWVMRPRDFTNIRILKDVDRRYQLEPDPTRAGKFMLFGHPVILSTRVPDTTEATPTARVALVDFAQIAVARDVAPSVKILDQTFGDFDQQAIRVTARYDAGPLNPKAIVVLTGVKTNP